MSSRRIPHEHHFLWKIDRWNGGKSEDSRIGLPGAFRYGEGLDIRSDSGMLKIANLPVLHSGATVLKEIHWMELNPANNDMYHYGVDTIYKETGGTYSSVHTISSDTPNAQGLCDFNGALYYRSATQLGKYDYASTWTDDFQTGLTNCANWSPMSRHLNLLLIGHGRYVASLDDVATWNATRLTLPPGYNVRDIFSTGSMAVILATRGTAITDSEDGMMFLWDGTSQTYNTYIPLNGNPHAGISNNNKITIIAGQETTIQESLGGMAVVVQTLTDVGIGKTAEIYPGAVDMWRNLIHFGISSGTSTTIPRGVYTYGSRNTKFPDCLNPVEYPSSSGVVLGTGIQITAVKKVGTTLRFAWKNGTTVGIDQIDTTQFQSAATYRSLAYDRTSPWQKAVYRVNVELSKALVTGESIDVYVSSDPYGDPSFSNSATYSTLTGNTVGDTLIEMPLSEAINGIRSRDLHLQLVLHGPNSSTPSIKRAWVDTLEDLDLL